MTRLKNDGGFMKVEFALEWRDRDGKWHAEVLQLRGAQLARRAELEAGGATQISEHMRDRCVSYTPWGKI